MSIHEIDRTSPLDPGPDESIRREVAETEEPGIGGDGEHERSPAGQEEEVESGGAKKEELEGEKEDQAPATAAPPTSATAANAKTTFGMKRLNPTVKKGNDSYDYEQKYPEDAPNEEAAPAARVWRTYEDESRNHDANMVEESRDNVDVLLVFAGLFSAVVTTFVAQTSQSLQPDYAAMSASLLYESVLVQRAIANGSPVNTITPSPLNPTIAFVPATTDVWVNGLWFTSLFLSLTTALVAVLVKQWLHHYVALPSGTPRDRSFTRQFRYAGFEKWHVQVIIGLLPVLMHLALAIFLSGLVIFLRPLHAALSWVICAGTILVYTAYVVATILPIIFPQCPYRTPLCDLVYISLHRLVPQVTWYDKKIFLFFYRQRDFSSMFHHLPHVHARTTQSLTTIESKFVQQMSKNLAAEALHWLFSVSSNPSVQSIVIQSVGGLPMASGRMVVRLQGPRASLVPMLDLRESLIGQCLLETKVSDHSYYEPVPGMELKLKRLLRFAHGQLYHRSFIYTPNVYSFDLTAAILSIDGTLCDRETLNESVTPGAFLMDNTRSKLSPSQWYFLMWKRDYEVLRPLDPNHANMFPLHLCSAILKSFARSPARLFFKSKDQSSVDEPLSLKSLRVLVLAIKFLLDRLSLPDSEMSHTTIRGSLALVTGQMWGHRFSSQEAIIVMPVLEDIIAHCLVPPLSIDSDDPGQDLRRLWKSMLLAYRDLTKITPSAYSLHGLQSMVDLMTRHWDQTAKDHRYLSVHACEVLTTLLKKHIPVAFTVFLDKQCLHFLGNHVFHEESVAMVSAYVAGILAMQQGSDGAVDAETLQPHIGYIGNPQNRFAACSILATHSIGNIDRSAIRRNITTLVRLCPTRDAAWDECCGKLRDLAQSDGGDFFSKQCVFPDIFRECRPLQADEIQIEKDNIKYAIQVLDDFFNGRAHTTDPVPSDSSPMPYAIGRLVGWCRRRKPDDGKPEQKQEV